MLNQNLERLTMRVSDHDGKWTENYDCAFWTWQNNDWVLVSEGELCKELLTNYQPPPIIFNVT